MSNIYKLSYTAPEIDERLGKVVDLETEVDNLSEEIENTVTKNQGSANVGKILVVGTDGNLVLTDMPEGGASGDVIGTLDESNNILLSGNLADGTYTLKYENEDGTYTDVGTLEVGAIPEPEEPTYSNLFNPSTCELNKRLDSSGVSTTGDGYILTDYIPIPSDVSVGNFRIRYKNANLVNSTSRIGLYNTSKTKVDVQYINGTTLYATGTDDNGVEYVDVLLEAKITASSYIRIAFYNGTGVAVTTEDAKNIIVTINEEIV